jgi:phosphoheptose isomerase
MKTISLLGKDGGKLVYLSDIPVPVLLKEMARIQEAHMVTHHAICGFLDSIFS